MRACNCARASPFQSRTREGGDRCYPICCRLRYQVSIHAPAWGATSLASHADASATAVSIHAPAWGATPSCRPSPAGIPCFNPRTRVGCDDLHRQGQSGVPPSFNPRTRVGCDGEGHRLDSTKGRFQSTHPRGVRRPWCSHRSRAACSFNPRTRVGCDGPRVRPAAEQAGFNPRTRVGCDLDEMREIIEACGFQSTHPRGVRLHVNMNQNIL